MQSSWLNQFFPWDIIYNLVGELNSCQFLYCYLFRLQAERTKYLILGHPFHLIAFWSEETKQLVIHLTVSDCSKPNLFNIIVVYKGLSLNNLH